MKSVHLEDYDAEMSGVEVTFVPEEDIVILYKTFNRTSCHFKPNIW